MKRLALLTATLLLGGSIQTHAEYVFTAEDWGQWKSYSIGGEDVYFDRSGNLREDRMEVGTTWMNPDYDDSAWESHTSGSSLYLDWPDEEAGIWIRKTFEADVNRYKYILHRYSECKTDYYINGEYSGSLDYDSSYEENYDITDQLQNGTNIIAVRALGSQDYGHLYYFSIESEAKPVTFDFDGVKYALELDDEEYTASIVGAESAVYGEDMPSYLALPAMTVIDGVSYTITSVIDRAMADKGIRGLTIPATYTQFINGAFENNFGLEYVIFLDEQQLLNAENAYAFSGCNNPLLYAPEGFDFNTLSWEWSIFFSSYKNGSEPPMPFEVDGIIYRYKSGSEVAVKGCNEAMTTVVIPATVSDGTATYNVARIDDKAFSGHPNVVSVDASHVYQYGNQMFTNCPKLQTVTVGGYVYAGQFENSPKIEAVNVVSDEPWYYSIDGVAFSESTLIYYPAGKTATSYTIPEVSSTGYEINRLGWMAFYKNPYIQELNIPSGVKEMDSEALFGLKNLKTINLYRRDTYGLNYWSLHYGGLEFDGEETLVTVRVPKGCVDGYRDIIGSWGDIPEWITIEEGDWEAPFVDEVQDYFIFEQIGLTNQVRLISYIDELRGSYDGRLVIPATVTINGTEYTVAAIGEGALRDLQIRELVLPETITRLGRSIIESQVPTTVILNGNVPEVIGSPFGGEIVAVQVPAAYYEAYAAAEYFRSYMLAIIGGLLNYEQDGLIYTQHGENVVSIVGHTSEYEDCQNVEIPATLSVDGKEYMVTRILCVNYDPSLAFNDVVKLTLPATIQYIQQGAIGSSTWNYNLEMKGDVPQLDTEEWDGNVHYYSPFTGWNPWYIYVEPTYYENYKNHPFFGDYIIRVIGGIYDFELDGIVYNQEGTDGLTIIDNTEDIHNHQVISIPAVIEQDGNSQPVTRINPWALYTPNCTELTLPASITYMGEGALHYCESIEKITFLGDVPELDTYETEDGTVFADCLREYRPWKPIYVKAEYYDNYAKHPLFSQWPIVVIGAVEDYVQDGIHYAQIGNTQNMIVTGCVYEDLEGVEDLVIPATVTVDGKDYNVTEIKAWALQDIRANIVLPATITKIGQHALEEISGIVTFLGAVPTLGEDIFHYANIPYIFVQPEYLEDYKANEYLKQYPIYPIGYAGPLPGFEFTQVINQIQLTFRVLSENEVAVAGCNVWFYYPTATDAVVPEKAWYVGNDKVYLFDVTEIASDAFRDTPVQTVTLPSSVQRIRSCAFYNCYELQTLTVPSSVNHICSSAFYSCSILQTITLECEASTVLEENIFDECYSLEKVYVTSAEPLQARGNRLINNKWRSPFLLIVPTVEAVEAYREYVYQEYEWSGAYSTWNNTFDLIGLEQDFTTTGLTLADGEAYVNVISQEIPSFTYDREFAEGVWTSVVLPVALSYSDWCETYDMADIYDVNVHDNDRDGQVDDIEIEGIYMRDGAETQAGVPYFIRRKAGAAHKPLHAENVMLEPAQAYALDGSNTKMWFWIYGTYTGMKGQQMVDNSYYAMAGGAWCLAADETVDLKPMRAYMQLFDRQTWEPIAITSGLERVRVRIEDIDEEEAITTVEADGEMGADDEVVISSRMIGLRKGRYQIGGRNVKVEN